MRDRRDGGLGNGEIKRNLGFGDTVLAASDHGVCGKRIGRSMGW